MISILFAAVIAGAPYIGHHDAVLTATTCFDGNGHAFPACPNGMCVMADRADTPTSSTATMPFPICLKGEKCLVQGVPQVHTFAGGVIRPLQTDVGGYLRYEKPLTTLIKKVGIHGYRCTNSGGNGGVVRWYDGTTEAWTIIVPGGPRAGSQSEFPMPLRIKDFHAKADKGIACTLSFPMDAP